MAQQTITQAATASLRANGTSTSTGSITWTAPTLPDGVTVWDSVRISGTWTWTGKGSITGVTINGTNTTNGVQFDIALSTGVRPPLSITCVGGNKNTTGSSFTWSGLQVAYTCTVASSEQLMIKVGGAWKEVQAVYRKVGGVWVEQDSLADLFSTGTKYVNRS